jgi:hypothetical protein
MTLAVDDSGGVARTISNDCTELSWETPREEQEITGLDKSAKERLLTLADFTVEISLVFNPTSNMSHDVFKTVPSTSVNRTTTITIPTPVSLAGELLYTNYSLERSDSGELTSSAEGSLADGAVPTWG